MVPTSEWPTYNSPISPRRYVTEKNPIARKSLHHFSDAFNVKPKTSVHKLGAAK